MELSFLNTLQNLHTPLLDQIMVFITTLGNGGMVWIALSIVLLVIPKYRIYGLTMLVALLISFIFGNVILKNIVARPRPSWVDPSVKLLIPNPSDYSFPSGHTFTSFASAGSLFLYNKKSGVAAIVLASLIGFSRMYLYVHYPSDVLAGALFGLAAAVAAFYGVQYITTRYKMSSK
ncbi:phosphatidic acid phosphatase type 2/haloperoxidase [Trichococcus palustris]|jgi:undecaprenyl-diphosphatase|uniref:Phosphatidic acid phosphatase type 2/haloperoxidase n=1 Tax=Trichococcus palustris TaxID=140314 RepID=A0A143YDK0_9LACT|nr:phosphatase PAP2 family protein [Trichococcus palustris]CZQ86361.1 phosphatidic acid phosphatase type 2/haloperoxidase [Trichococcus palustris]SFK58502.1 undecaprenyl-diphosphatase [Trichococcus palustris]